jgi:hypothetical protein
MPHNPFNAGVWSTNTSHPASPPSSVPPSDGIAFDQPVGVEFTSNSLVASHIGCTAIARPPRPTNKLVSDDEYIGIELELEQCSSSSLATAVHPLWETVSDGSLKLNGREYRYAQPLAGKDIIDSLNVFEKALIKEGITPYHGGNRGSTHFHLNVSNMSVPALYYLTLLSYFMEPVLTATCRPDRSSNSFAVSVSKTKDSMVVLDKIRSGSFMFNDSSWKYRAIGLNSIYGKGSLEYRMFHSSHDMGEILKWINAVLAIKKVSGLLGDRIPSVIKKGLESSPQDAIDEMFNGVYDFSESYDIGSCAASLWEFTRMYTYNFKDELQMSSNVSSYYKKVMGV